MDGNDVSMFVNTIRPISKLRSVHLFWLHLKRKNKKPLCVCCRCRRADGGGGEVASCFVLLFRVCKVPSLSTSSCSTGRSVCVHSFQGRRRPCDQTGSCVSRRMRWIADGLFFFLRFAVFIGVAQPGHCQPLRRQSGV